MAGARGAGYQPGEANFAAIQAWNAASVYQRAIALIGERIDRAEETRACLNYTIPKRLVA